MSERYAKFLVGVSGDSFNRSKEESFLMAPKDNKIFHWKNVSYVKEGDIIFNYFRKEIVAISTAKKDAYLSKYINRDNVKEDFEDGWKVDIDLYELKNKIPLQKIGNKISAFNEKYSPIDKNGNANQGYLFSLSNQTAKIIADNINFY